MSRPSFCQQRPRKGRSCLTENLHAIAQSVAQLFGKRMACSREERFVHSSVGVQQVRVVRWRRSYGWLPTPITRVKIRQKVTLAAKDQRKIRTITDTKLAAGHGRRSDRGLTPKYCTIGMFSKTISSRTDSADGSTCGCFCKRQSNQHICQWNATSQTEGSEKTTEHLSVACADKMTTRMLSIREHINPLARAVATRHRLGS